MNSTYIFKKGDLVWDLSLNEFSYEKVWRVLGESFGWIEFDKSITRAYHLVTYAQSENTIAREYELELLTPIEILLYA